MPLLNLGQLFEGKNRGRALVNRRIPVSERRDSNGSGLSLRNRPVQLVRPAFHRAAGRGLVRVSDGRVGRYVARPLIINSDLKAYVRVTVAANEVG